MTQLTVIAINGLPEIRPGDDLAMLLERPAALVVEQLGDD